MSIWKPIDEKFSLTESELVTRIATRIAKAANYNPDKLSFKEMKVWDMGGERTLRLDCTPSDNSNVKELAERLHSAGKKLTSNFDAYGIAVIVVGTDVRFCMRPRDLPTFASRLDTLDT